MHEPLRSIGKYHLERALRACLVLFVDGICNFVDLLVDHGVVLGDVTGVWLEGLDDLAALFGFTVCD